jgi:hypothetical protein
VQIQNGSASTVIIGPQELLIEQMVTGALSAQGAICWSVPTMWQLVTEIFLTKSLVGTQQQFILVLMYLSNGAVNLDIVGEYRLSHVAQGQVAQFAAIMRYVLESTTLRL